MMRSVKTIVQMKYNFGVCIFIQRFYFSSFITDTHTMTRIIEVKSAISS